MPHQIIAGLPSTVAGLTPGYDIVAWDVGNNDDRRATPYISCVALGTKAGICRARLLHFAKRFCFALKTTVEVLINTVETLEITAIVVHRGIEICSCNLMLAKDSLFKFIALHFVIPTFKHAYVGHTLGLMIIIEHPLEATL